MNEIVSTELQKHEAVIEKNLKAFYEVGYALKTIRDERLYREDYATFEDYCRERWEFNSSRARQLIMSVDVADKIESVTCVTPATEYHIRPLTKLEPELQKEAWQKAVETAPDGKITARHVSRVVSDILHDDREKQIRKRNKVIDEVRVHPDFERTYRAFYREVQNAKLEGWKDTSKDEALRLVNNIIDLITIT